MIGHGVKLRVVLLGSAPLLVQQGLSESLAGRLEVLRVPHWSFAGMRDAFGFSPEHFLCFGGYPGSAPLARDAERWRSHEYERKGAVNLLAAINTRTGKVLGLCRRRKRQRELIELLEEIERTTPSTITVIHIVCDNVRVHKGKEVQAWLAVK